MTIDQKETLINSLEELNSMAEKENKLLYANIYIRYAKGENQYLIIQHITSEQFRAEDYENPATQNKGIYEYRSLELVDLIPILRIIPAEILDTPKYFEEDIEELKEWIEFVKLCNQKKENKGANL